MFWCVRAAYIFGHGSTTRHHKAHSVAQHVAQGGHHEHNKHLLMDRCSQTNRNQILIKSCCLFQISFLMHTYFQVLHCYESLKCGHILTEMNVSPKVTVTNMFGVKNVLFVLHLIMKFWTSASHQINAVQTLVDVLFLNAFLATEYLWNTVRSCRWNTVTVRLCRSMEYCYCQVMQMSSVTIRLCRVRPCYADGY